MKPTLLIINIDKILVITLALISAAIIFYNSGVQYSFSVLLMFYTICMLALYGVFLSKDQYSFSLNKVFNIFYFFFFGLAPAVQYKFENSFFNAPKFSEADYLKGGAILLIVLILYLLLYKLGHSFYLNKIRESSIIETINEPLWWYYLAAIGALLLTIIIVKFNFEVLFLRPPANFLKLNTNFGLVGYSVLLIVRAVSIIILLRYLLIGGSNWKHIILLGAIALLTAFPFSLSRGIAAAYYIPFIVFLNPIKKSKYYYASCYFLGVFLIFPLLNIFRNGNNHLSLGVAAFKTGHFDAFQNFLLLINEEIITGGRQLLGALLFFVQDSTWFTKPLGTGTLLATTLNFNHINVAMPYFGEGYANFGYVGIALFLVLIVILNAYLDTSFHNKKQSLFIKTGYLFLLGFEFYLLRGDLSSSVKKGTSFLLALILVHFYIKIMNKLTVVSSRKLNE
ncbi:MULTISPECIES: O-antigen polysaccharide polymerase Wzy [Flavobacteriaceae]|uniref:O-antigen polysaccharide polymerase Wzy n=2 Tax=Flavobacteriaceae TaxID=49546 RepID=A0A4Y8ATP9_9FLAO|nr:MULTISPECIES: O-antigen polysaccharide polymerase Wzy [Flavobacteriaceae]TEW75247.1 O-antigen polysaccharide polymerase Wzy [Gramella jeungdoensis]GGK60513.1 hypothetical protein GCM10007963_30770 [Lutibacter litoralis]